MSVEQCVRRLKRFHNVFWRIHQICLAHINAEPLYELKMAWSLHSHLAAENDTNLRKRIGEMREPPLGLEKSQHAALDVFFDEILATPSREERLLGLYDRAFPALRDALRRYIQETHPLADRCAGSDGGNPSPDQRQAVGLLPRHDTPTLGRGAPCDDGRDGFPIIGTELAATRHDQLDVVIRAEQTAHAEGASRRSLLACRPQRIGGLIKEYCWVRNEFFPSPRPLSQ